MAMAPSLTVTHVEHVPYLNIGEICLPSLPGQKSIEVKALCPFHLVDAGVTEDVDARVNAVAVKVAPFVIGLDAVVAHDMYVLILHQAHVRRGRVVPGASCPEQPVAEVIAPAIVTIAFGIVHSTCAIEGIPVKWAFKVL